MKLVQEAILVMTSDPVAEKIKNCIDQMGDIQVLEADSEKKAFELIYTHSLVLIIAQDTLSTIDLNAVGTMLMSHRKTHAAPLLVLSENDETTRLSERFDQLIIDYMPSSFTSDLAKAKFKILFELHRLNSAVKQSMDELDLAYNTMISQKEMGLDIQSLEKTSQNILNKTTNQIRMPIKEMLASTSHLLRDKQLSNRSRSILLNLKTNAERISRISKQGLSYPRRALSSKKYDQLKQVELTQEQDNQNSIQILYADPSIEDFNLFKYSLAPPFSNHITHVQTMADGLEKIAGQSYDLIVLAHHFKDGSGIQFLSRLKRTLPDVPVIFNINQAHTHDSQKMMEKGAFAVFIKETLSSEKLFTTILNTFEKAQIIRDGKDARDRIALISRKDSLTRLFNRQIFEKRLAAAISSANRYQTDLSVVLIGLNRLEAASDADARGTDASDAGKLVLSATATLIQSIIRDSDTACRFEKNIFGLLLPHTLENGAKILANRLAEKINMHLQTLDVETEPFTITTGVASYSTMVGKTNQTLPGHIAGHIDGKDRLIQQALKTLHTQVKAHNSAITTKEHT